MFGFSLTKLIFTTVIVYVAWQVFKVIARRQEQSEKRAKMDRHAASRESPHDRAGVEDLVQCSKCHAYVARGAKSCGQDGCPFLG